MSKLDYLRGAKAQLDLDLLAWHDKDDGEYANYFKEAGDTLLEQISILEEEQP